MMPPPLALTCRHPPPPLKFLHFVTDSAPSYPNITLVTTPNLAVRPEIQTLIKSIRYSRKWQFIFYIKFR